MYSNLRTNGYEFLIIWSGRFIEYEPSKEFQDLIVKIHQDRKKQKEELKIQEQEFIVIGEWFWRLKND